MNAKEFTILQWREAAKDLGFEFIAPYQLMDGPQPLLYVGLVAGFGSDRGTLIIDDAEKDRLNKLMLAASDQGFGYSCMTMGFAPYDRDIMMEVLREWEWCGAAKHAPKWISDSRTNVDEADIK